MKNIDDILNSADGAIPAEPAPFFTTRTQARLDRVLDKKAAPLGFTIKRPVWVAALLILCIGANLAMISAASDTKTKGQSNYKTTEVNALAADFNFISGYSY